MDAFPLDGYELLNESQIEKENPLTIRGPSQKWSYSISIPNSLSVWEASRHGAVDVVIHVAVLSGKLSVGLVRQDYRTFIVQQDVTEREQITQLRFTAASLADVASIVFRNGDSDVPVRFSVHDLSLDKASPVSEEIVPRGFENKSIVGDISRISQTEIVNVYDVGANVGDMTDAFVSAFPSARIHTFEPHPDVAESTRKRFALEPRVTVKNCALGARQSTLQLYCYSNSAINSLNPVSKSGTTLMDGDVSVIGTIPAEVETIDHLMTVQKLEILDLLKMDTQGYEMQVLRGAQSALKEHRIRFIVAELLFVPLYEHQCFFPEVTHYLWELGYELFDFYDFVYDAQGHVKWGDALFRAR